MQSGLPPPDNEMPMRGPGTSDGPGTYRRFKNKQIEMELRFDPRRKPEKGHGKGRSR
jgi:hypothetical protein